MIEQDGPNPLPLGLIDHRDGELGHLGARAQPDATGEAQGLTLPPPPIEPHRHAGDVVLAVRPGEIVQFPLGQGRFAVEEAQALGIRGQPLEAVQQELPIPLT